MLKLGWKALVARLISDPALPLEKQIYQGICLLGGGLSLFVVLPLNHLQHLDPWVNRLLIPFGFGLLAFGWLAHRGHYFRKTTFLWVVVFLDLVWFPNAGSQGSIGLYFFAAALFLVLFLEGVSRYLGLVLLLLNIISLHVAELFWPNLMHTFSPLDRLVDLSTGYVVSLLISALMLWLVLAGFNREKARLAESERLYRELLTGQGEGFGVVDSEERFILANPVAEEIFGVGPGQLKGRCLLDFVLEEQQDLVRQETVLRATGAHSTYELWIRREDGALRTLQVTATPRPRQGEETLQVIGVFRDITERKQIEEQLRESEEKFRTYVDQSIDVIFTLDSSGHFIFASPAWEHHFGYPVSQIVGHPFSKFVHESDIQPCFVYLTRVMSTGQSETSPPYRVRHADGSWRWFRANGIRTFTAEAEPRFMGVAHDITERKEAEEALKASEERYRSQFDRASEGICTLSPEGDLLEVNDALAQMHGYSVDEMKKLNLKDLDTPASAELSHERMDQLLAGVALTIEVEHFHKDGHTFPLEVSASLVTTGGRRTVLCFHRDITERKRAEETNRLLLQEKNQAQKLDSLGSLAGGVAHDFNNMLGGVMGYADLLLAEEEDPRRQKYLHAILSAASRSAELTQKLLAFGRRGKNLVESLDLPSMVEECLGLLRPSMSPDLNIVLTMEGCPTVDGDPSQIHQVLVNLCINALEAMPKGGTLTIAARGREVEASSPPGGSLSPGSYVEISVTDTGAGMTEEIRHRVFEPFFTTKSDSGMSGTGLGLSTVFGIIQAHRGTITVDSTPGKGSTFRILLPEGTLPDAKTQVMGSPIKGTGLVLLVEDEVLLRELGILALESLGYQALTASDGVEAVEAFRSHHPNLCAVLLDLKMPRMAGRETFQELRRINPAVPVIVCTGYGENEEVQELLTQGAKTMLTKPYQLSALSEKLRNVTTTS